jgi:hypothetical protein
MRISSAFLSFRENKSRADDARWHSKLCELRFPILEGLNVWKTSSAETANTEEAILHYAHPGLRYMRVEASSPLSDRFLDELSCLSPRLRELDIDFKNATISKPCLARFPDRTTSLEGIHVAELDKSWKIEAFIAVAKYERLELLQIPAVPDVWFDDNRLSSVSYPFPALKNLDCLGMTANGLNHMHASNIQLEALHLLNIGVISSDPILPAAAQFSQLTIFSDRPGPRGKITGHDLLALAHGCPSLTSLSIGEELTPHPIGTDIDDQVLYTLAKALPSLEELTLLYSSTRFPSISSILFSFTRHCPLLQRLQMCCGSDWLSLGVGHNMHLLPSLSGLRLQPRLHINEVLEVFEFHCLLLHFWETAACWFPKLQYFWIEDQDDYESQLMNLEQNIVFRDEQDVESSEDDTEYVVDDQDGKYAQIFPNLIPIYVGKRCQAWAIDDLYDHRNH